VKTHTNRQFEAELRLLKERIIFMASQVEEMIAQTMKSLVTRDSLLAENMIKFDHQINALELEIDELCLRLLALRQPAGSDLRFITIALKIVTDLERMGDMGVNIAERTLELNQEPPLKPYIDLPNMAKLVQGMVKQSLDAFVKSDLEMAQEVLRKEEMVDQLNVQILRELLTYMIEDPKNITRGLRLIFISKYLERIADHATNIAEMVFFMVKGKDIRHLEKTLIDQTTLLSKGTVTE